MPFLTTLCLPVSFLTGLVLSAVMFPPYIAWLKKRQIGQFIREEGPQSHVKKASTPTMGGACFMVSFLMAGGAGLYAAGAYGHRAFAALSMLVALLAGAIGLADDTAKLKRKANAGISAKSRLLLETALGLIFAALLLWLGDDTSVLVGGARAYHSTDFDRVIWTSIPPALYFAACAFYMAATTNALNLHDGMDGLAAGTSLVTFLTLAAMLFMTGQVPLAVVATAAAGAVGGFLIYNRYKASIFMGDTGSLFLGGLMALLVIAGKLELWFIPLSLIYILEALSVIIQVIYFKLTKDYQPDKPMPAPALVWLKLTKRLPGEGKRFFRMAPLHHHFEAVGAEMGVAEWQVVLCFWLAQLALSLAVLVLFKMI